MAIMGPSGSGKSTLMNMLGGLDRPTTANTASTASCVRSRTTRSPEVRTRVGFVFQSFNLLPRLTLAERRAAADLCGHAAQERRERAKALERVGLGTRMGHRPSELSGGQQQRVARSRLVTAPTCCWPTSPPATWIRPRGETSWAVRGAARRGQHDRLVTHEAGHREARSPRPFIPPRRHDRRRPPSSLSSFTEYAHSSYLPKMVPILALLGCEADCRSRLRPLYDTAPVETRDIEVTVDAAGVIEPESTVESEV